MGGLVEQLQVEALDRNVEIGTLLRRTKLAAVKLGLSDAVRWVDAELSGYQEEPPGYRRVRGQALYWNPYHGWQPISSDRGDIMEALSVRSLMEPVTSLEETLKGRESTLIIPYHGEVLAGLSRIFGMPIGRAGLEVSRGALTRVLEHARNLVFEWALGLEKAGITGDGISFSLQERERASAAAIHIGAFHGVLSTADLSGANSRINYQSADSSTNTVNERQVFDEIEAAIRGALATGEERAQILRELRSLEASPSGASRLNAYQRLVSAMADHMGVLGPFLPALTKFLGIAP